MKLMNWKKPLGVGFLLGAIVCPQVTVRAAEKDTIWSAASKGNLAQVKQFLKARPSLLNAKDPKESFEGPHYTPLENALAGRKSEVAKYLLSCGAKWDKNTILGTAASGGDLELVRYLVGKGANVNARTYFTPLSAALDKPKIMEFLLAKGADVHGKNVNGMTPFEQAAYNWQVEGMEVLAAHKAMDRKAKTSALFTVAQSQYMTNAKAKKDQHDVIKLLLAHGADSNAKDGNGQTADSYVTNLETKNLILKAQGKATAAAGIQPNAIGVQPGEIALAGAFVSFDVDNKKLVLKATSFTLPNGKSATIAQPKDKIVQVDGATTIHMQGQTAKMAPNDLGAGRPGNAFIAIGPDAGSGQALTARR